MARTNLARKLGKTAPSVKTVAVVLDQSIADAYEAQADGTDLGGFLSERLEDRIVINHTSDKPLYFTDDQRQELDKLLNYNFNTAAEVLDRVRSLVTAVAIDDGFTVESVVLSPTQLYRLAERARIRNLPISKLATELSVDGINREIGLF